MDEAIKIILTYGPGGVIAALVILGVLVPRSYYDREIKRGDTATEATSKTAESVKLVTDALVTVTTEVKSLKTEIEQLRKDIRAIRASGGEE